jgi:hypothetical protein
MASRAGPFLIYVNTAGMPNLKRASQYLTYARRRPLH